MHPGTSRHQRQPDGQYWFTFTMDPAFRENPNFSDPSFPGNTDFGRFYADGFAPTLGRVYEPDKIECADDPNCMAYWGSDGPDAAADPAVLETDLRNATLAEIALLYGRSAGGRLLIYPDSICR